MMRTLSILLVGLALGLAPRAFGAVGSVPLPTGGSSTNATLDPTNQVLVNLIGTVANNVTNIAEGNKVYVRTNGSDATGIRGRIDWPFLTLTGAKAAAVYGDTVMVGPGLYSANNTNLLKGGVNWFFDTGAVISNRVQQAGDDFWIGIFDDRFSGAVTSTVAGNLKVIWDMTDYDLGGVNVNTLGPVVITNAGSEMTFRAKSMETWATDAPNVGLGGMYIVNCRQFFVDVDEFYAPEYGEDDGILVAAAAMYWERGNVFGRIGRIHTEGYGVWANQPIDGKGTTNDLYLLGDLWETTAQSAIYTSMSNTTHRAWFRVAELRTSFGGFSTISLYNGGRVYVDSLKISGRSQNTTILADRDGTIYAGVEGWVTAQKISGDSKWVLNNNGNLYVTAQQYEDTGSDATDKLFDLQGGYARLIGGHAKAFANGIWQAGGTNVIDGLRMDSAAVANVTNVPLTYKGGLLTVKDVSLTATNNAANAVNAVAAQTLTVEGYLNANKIIDADVTLAGTSTNTITVLHLPNLATNGFLQLGAGGIVRTGALSGFNQAVDGTLSPAAAGDTYQIQYNTNDTFTASPSLYYNVLTNEVVVSNNFAGGAKLSLIGASGRTFSFKVEDGTNRITSSMHLILDMGALGNFVIKTNNFSPPQNGSTPFGSANVRWFDGHFWTNTTTNLYVFGEALFHPTNANSVSIRAANSNAFFITNIVGLVEVANATPLFLNCNFAHQYNVTNRLTAATTLVFTNTAPGQEYSVGVIGEASGGAARVVTLIPTLGNLVANLDTFGTALATSGSFTLTNGNAVEINVKMSKLNGTNIFGFVTRQFSF